MYKYMIVFVSTVVTITTPLSLHHVLFLIFIKAMLIL